MKEIGKTSFSYHQIRIFIKLFIYQYSKLKNKLKFIKNVDNNCKIETEKCISAFAKGTRYLICGGFSKKLIEDAHNGNKKDKLTSIELLSEIYYNNPKENYDVPLIFINEEENNYFELDISDKGLDKYKTSTEYLKILKVILRLNNPIEGEGEKGLKSLKSIIDKDQYNHS